jgi:hypothetical protein
MTRSIWWWVLTLAALLGFVSSVAGQLSSPHIGYAYPAGGQQNTTFDIKLGGLYLDGAATLSISGAGVQGKVLSHTQPLTQKQINDLRDKIKELQKKKNPSTSEQQEIRDIQAKLAKAAIRPTPALAETVTARITIAADAAPGPRELRVAATTGMSNPVVFDVGQLPELRQAKELFDPEATARKGLGRYVNTRDRPRTTEVTVTLPTVLNSQILPGQVDRYRFSARRGQQLVFVTRARALIPYLADAVPGWFQATLTLYDAQGNEVAYNDDFRHQPDPVLSYRVPTDGDYVLEIKDALYRGREDFVYRIEAGELPFITNIFPLGGKAETATTVHLDGLNLPQDTLTVKARDMKPGVIPLTVRKGDLVSNRVPFIVQMLPEFTEQESNNPAALAQPITLPVIVNGCIELPGDVDVFRLEGRAGQAVVAEVRARRLGSQLDSTLKLTDAGGKVIAFNDDSDDKGQGLETHHADSLLRATLPADGVYILHVADAQRHGSPAHAYRLRVGWPRPDFELRVTPSSINAKPGTAVAITVFAVRKDGFSREIDLALKGAPPQFSLDAAKIPANHDEIRLTLQVPANASEKPFHLAIEGQAWAGSQRLVHTAVPADDMMQAFAYHHLVPATDLTATVSGRARARFPARLLERGPVKITPGGTAVVRFAIPRGPSAAKFELALNDPPEGISLKKAIVNGDAATLELQADAKTVKQGLKANLIVEAFPEGAKKAAGGKQTRVPLGTLPAVPFEVLKVSR